MLKLQTELHVRSCLSVDSKAHDFICITFDLTKIDLTGLLPSWIEFLWTSEVLHLLRCSIGYLGCDVDLHSLKIGWHLELNNKFLTIYETETLQLFGDRYAVDIVDGCELHIHIFQ